MQPWERIESVLEKRSEKGSCADERLRKMEGDTGGITSVVR